MQTNFGGILTIAGASVGQELGQYYLRDDVQPQQTKPDGSCMVVIATDAPLDSRNLQATLSTRLAGACAHRHRSASNGSGDYAIAFSTAPQVRIRTANSNLTRSIEILTNDAMSPLFEAVIEATEEAVYNSMFKATSVSGNGHTIEALPIDRTVALLKARGALREQAQGR